MSEPEPEGAGPMEGVDPEPASVSSPAAAAAEARLARAARQEREEQRLDCDGNPCTLAQFIPTFGGTAADPPQEWLDAPIYTEQPAAIQEPPAAAGSQEPSAAIPSGSVRAPDSQTTEQLLPPANVTNMQSAMECPITMQMFIEPVTTPGGITYERGALIEALRRDPRCPSSRTPLTIEECTPNRALMSMCETLRRSAGTELFNLMRTHLAANFTEADLSRVHEEMLKKEKKDLKTREQFEKAQADAKKKKNSTAGNISIQKNILLKERNNKEGYKKLMVSMATSCGVNQEKFEWLVKAANEPSFEALLKAIKGKTGTDAKITQANVKITKFKLDYERHSTMAAATFEQRITAEMVEKDTNTLAATTAAEDAKKAGLNFDFMKGGGDPSVWEKNNTRRKDDEDDDDLLIAFASCVI